MPLITPAFFIFLNRLLIVSVDTPQSLAIPEKLARASFCSDLMMLTSILSIFLLELMVAPSLSKTTLSKFLNYIIFEAKSYDVWHLDVFPLLFHKISYFGDFILECQ